MWSGEIQNTGYTSDPESSESSQMADMLERESVEAWEERKRKARVLGEAAATKLLFPMMLMLVVVMAIVMIPAFLSFYGGT